MTSQERLEALIRRAVLAIDGADKAEFLAAMGELEDEGWDASVFKITETIFIAVEFLPPPVDADAAAALTRRIIQRFEGSLNITAPIMEAVIRSAAGDGDVIKGVPRDWALVHSVVAVGQIVHDGYATIDEILAQWSDEVE